MSTVKDYIVNYNITANASGAETILKKFSENVGTYSKNIETVKVAIQDMARAMVQLKEASNFTFAPKLNKAQLDAELNTMLTAVKEVAAQMHSALQSALTPTPTQKKQAQKAQKIQEQKAQKSAVSSKTNVTPATIREWKKTFGDSKSKSLTVRISGNAEGPNGALTVLNKVKTDLASMSKNATITVNIALNEESIAAIPAKLSKIKTPTIMVNAKLNQETVALIKEKIAKLRIPAIMVNAKLNQESITIIKEKIQKIKAPAIMVTAKLDGGSVATLKEKAGQIKLPTLTVNAKLNTAAIKEQAEKLGVAVGSKGGAKGGIKAKETAKETNKALGMLAKGQNTEIVVSLNTTAAEAKLAEFISLIQSKSPQNIQLGATGTPPKGGGTGGGGGTRGSGGAAPTGFVGGGPSRAYFGPAKPSDNSAPKAPHQPSQSHVNRARQIKQSLGRFASSASQYKFLLRNHSVFSAVAKDMRFTPTPDMTSEQMLPYLQRVSARMPAFNTSVEDQIALRNHISKIPRPAPAPHGFVGSGVNQVFFGNQKPDAATAPKGYHWVPRHNLTPRLNPAQLDAYNKQFGHKHQHAEKSWKKANDKLKSRSKFLSKELSRLSNASEEISKLQNQIAALQKPLEEARRGFEKRKEQYNKSKSNDRLKRLQNAQRVFNSVNGQVNALQSQLEQLRADAATVPALRAQAEKVSRKIANIRQSTDLYRRNLGKGYALEKNRSASPWHMQKAQMLTAQAKNHLGQFVTSESQRNALFKYRRFFNLAQQATGITPTPGMAPAQMLPYLQNVTQQMSSRGVVVPMQLQSHISKLEKQVARGEGGAVRGAGRASAGNEKSLSQRLRKAAFPLTGPTSFGVRTPMAVDMAKGMGVMFAIGGAMSAISSSFSQAMDYQNTMATTKAILENGTDNYTASGYNRMTRTIRDVGIKTKFSAPEVANAARFLAMAGQDIDSIDAAMRPIADLALIGDLDLGETADKVTNIMTGLQIPWTKMREVANVLATTATRSNTDIMMLAESFKYAGGIAKIYGKNDENLLADTAAIFGVMGNAGVQASSAGTALRMMYQNIFHPGTKQQKILDHIRQYGITTKDEEGNNRAMSAIISDIARLVPDKEMSDIVGGLFRITAIPGAAAAIAAAAESDGADPNDTLNNLAALENSISSKSGLSNLARLMQANRASIHGNISEVQAEAKQNTIQGLWSQVTSTFTEGIVKAFEQRQGGFESILKGLRDYLAKPETVRMLQNILDLVIDIGKVMAKFLGLWAKLYSTFPNIFKFWITAQMFFTQIGYLIGPFIALHSALVSLKGIATALGLSFGSVTTGTALASGGATVAGSAAASRVAGTALANGGATAVGTAVGAGTSSAVRGAAAVGGSTVARTAAAGGSSLVGEALAIGGATAAGNAVSGSGNSTARAARAAKEPRTHSKEVIRRAKRMNSINGQLTAKGKRNAIKSAYRSASAASAARMAQGAASVGASAAISAGLYSAGTKTAQAFGSVAGIISSTLVGSAAIATTALVGVGYALNQVAQEAAGATVQQIEAREKMSQIMDEAAKTRAKNSKWWNEWSGGKEHKPVTVGGPTDSEEEQSTATHEENKAIYDSTSATNVIPSALSAQTMAMAAQDLLENNTPQNRLVLGRYAKEVLDTKPSKQVNEAQTAYLSNVVPPVPSAAVNYAPTLNAMKYSDTQTKRRIAAIANEAVNAPETQKAVQDIKKQYQRYKNKEIDKNEYDKQTEAIRGRFKRPDNLISVRNWNDKKDGPIGDLSSRKGFEEYYNAQTDFLNAVIAGDDGTFIANDRAYDYFQQNKGKSVDIKNKDWWQSVRNIIGDFPIVLENIKDVNNKMHQVKTRLHLLPNNIIDFSQLSRDFIEQANGVKATLDNFAMAAAGIYASADGLRGYTGITRNQAISLVQQSLAHQTVTAQDAEHYWQKYIANDDESLFNKMRWGRQRFVDFVLKGQGVNAGDRITIGDKHFSSQYYRNRIRNAMGKEAVDKVWPSENTNTNSNTKDTSGLTSQLMPSNWYDVPDQNLYSSNYSVSQPSPTQIILNVNTNFDRTTVESGATQQNWEEFASDGIAEAISKAVGAAAEQYSSSWA